MKFDSWLSTYSSTRVLVRVLDASMCTGTRTSTCTSTCTNTCTVRVLDASTRTKYVKGRWTRTYVHRVLECNRQKSAGVVPVYSRPEKH